MTAHLHVQEMGADGQKANQIGKGHRARPFFPSPKELQNGKTKKKDFLFFRVTSTTNSSFFDILHQLVISPSASSHPLVIPTTSTKLSEMTGPKKEGQKKEYYITSDGYDQVGQAVPTCWCCRTMNTD